MQENNLDLFQWPWANAKFTVESKPRLYSKRECLAGNEKCCSNKIPMQPDRAWALLQNRSVISVQMCNVRCDFPCRLICFYRQYQNQYPDGWWGFSWTVWLNGVKFTNTTLYSLLELVLKHLIAFSSHALDLSETFDVLSGQPAWTHDPHPATSSPISRSPQIHIQTGTVKTINLLNPFYSSACVSAFKTRSSQTQ